MSHARRNVRLYLMIKDRKSPLKGSRPSVPHGTNYYYYYFISMFVKEAAATVIMYCGLVVTSCRQCLFWSADRRTVLLAADGWTSRHGDGAGDKTACNYNGYCRVQARAAVHSRFTNDRVGHDT